MAVCAGRAAGRGRDILLGTAVLLLGAMGSFGSGWLTQEREGLPFSLRLSCVFSLGTGAWGHVSLWSAKVARGEISGAGGL